MNIPSDFYQTYSILKKEKRLSVSALVRHYNVSRILIDKWLKESELEIKKINQRSEDRINLKEFEKDASSGNFTSKELSKKYKVRIYEIAKRNSIELNLKSNLFEPEDKEELIRFIQENGKTKAAEKYGVTLAVITGWCKRNNVEIEKYLGLKRKDVDDNELKIVSLYLNNYSINELAIQFCTSIPKIKSVLKKNKIELRKTQFQLWEDERISVRENIEKLAKENRNGKSLLEISREYSISYEVLKSEFKNNKIDVTLYSYNKSKGELELKDFVNSLGFESKSVKFTHDNTRFEIDCYIEDLKIGFEYCGEYWHSVNSGTHRLYHQKKYLWAEEQGIRLITIFENEWYRKKDLIKDMIRVRLGKVQKRIYARSTEAFIISNNQAKMFHEENHINGGLKTSSINIGLFHDNCLISVASFSKSRFDKNIDFELLRFSTKRSFLVVGGFSKILKNFLNMHPNASLLSYCDLRFGNGLVYERSGFEFVSLTPPNYWYFYKNGADIGFESRLKYQKHKLKIFSNYSIDKTEFQIMEENGYLKIYDCGNKKYVYNRKGGE